MNILVAIDSMKGSLSSHQANQIVSSVGKDYGHKIQSVTVSDGGEGFLASFLDMDLDYKEQTAVVSNLYNTPTEVSYLYSETRKVVIIESAQIVGLEMLLPEKTWRDTTSAGVGELIKQVQEKHQVKQIIVGLGGTGTIDGGFGCLNELGVKFYDSEDRELSCFAENLEYIQRVSFTETFLSSSCELLVANDVTNLLYGPTGATMIYGQQKGLSKDDQQIVDSAIEKMYLLLNDEASKPGDGAAGGLGFALRFLGGRSQSGFEIIAQTSGLYKLLTSCDLVITGEGRMDGQTLNGKLPKKISELAKVYNLPCVAFVGAVTEDYQIYREVGFYAVYPICKQPEELTKALKRADENLRFAAYSFFGTIAVSEKKFKKNSLG